MTKLKKGQSYCPSCLEGALTTTTAHPGTVLATFSCISCLEMVFGVWCLSKILNYYYSHSFVTAMEVSVASQLL